MNPGKTVVTEALRTPPVVLTVKSNAAPLPKNQHRGPKQERERIQSLNDKSNCGGTVDLTETAIFIVIFAQIIIIIFFLNINVLFISWELVGLKNWENLNNEKGLCHVIHVVFVKQRVEFNS